MRETKLDQEHIDRRHGNCRVCRRSVAVSDVSIDGGVVQLLSQHRGVAGAKSGLAAGGALCPVAMAWGALPEKALVTGKLSLRFRLISILSF